MVYRQGALGGGASGVQEKCYVLTRTVFIWIKWQNSLSCTVIMLLYVSQTSIKTLSILAFIMGKTYYERKEREYLIILTNGKTLIVRIPIQYVLLYCYLGVISMAG